MKDTKLQTWILWAVALFLLSLTVDYFFLHLFFEKDTSVAQVEMTTAPADGLKLEGPAEPVDVQAVNEPADKNAPAGDGNFLATLKQCAPDIAAQAIATPEALVEYLSKSVGAAKEDITLENYFLTLPDGGLRQVQVLKTDTATSSEKRELRHFAVDAQGHPQPLPLKDNDSKESLLRLGKVSRQETKSELQLRDGSKVLLEKHDNRVFELQYHNRGKVLSCQYTKCTCS